MTRPGQWTTELNIELDELKVLVECGNDGFRSEGYSVRAKNALSRLSNRLQVLKNLDLDWSDQQSFKGTKPSEEAIIAWRLRYVIGLKSQAEIADEMTKQLRRKVHQGSVSRWLKEARSCLQAGGIFPPLRDCEHKPVQLDPNRIDMGERQDRRTARQRAKRDTP